MALYGGVHIIFEFYKVIPPLQMLIYKFSLIGDWKKKSFRDIEK